MAFSQQPPLSFEAALLKAREILSRSHALIRKGTIEAEAEILVLAAFRRGGGASLNRAELHLRIKDRFPEAAGEALLVLAAQRSEGIPLQHLIGYQLFLSNEYEVGPDVLIPRPETELMVAELIDDLARAKPAPQTMVEIGLGSGVISIELLFRFPKLRAWASELSEVAVLRALKNAAKILGPAVNQQGRLTIVRPTGAREVWSPFEGVLPAGGVDVIVSNPPYLSANDEIEDEVRLHEPGMALFAPAGDVLFFYREIAAHARSRLRPGGAVWLEMPHERAGEIRALFESAGWHVEIRQDLTGRDRIVKAT